MLRAWRQMSTLPAVWGLSGVFVGTSLHVQGNGLC